MSYNESDFYRIIDLLEEICRKNYPEEFKVELVRHVIRLYKKIPLYPGLAADCVRKSIVKVTLDKLKVRQKYLVLVNGKYYYDQFLKMSKKSLEFKFFKTSLASVNSIYGIDRNILEKLWPTLVSFKKEK